MNWKTGEWAGGVINEAETTVELHATVVFFFQQHSRYVCSDIYSVASQLLTIIKLCVLFEAISIDRF